MLLTLGLSSAHADTSSHTFSVEVNVPHPTFYVVGDDGWESRTQLMTWNEQRFALSDINRLIKAKNTQGGINVWLDSAPVLTSQFINDSIPLKVTIAGKTVGVGSAQKSELLSPGEAVRERTLALNVSQQQAFTQRPTSGTYEGAVTLIFDSGIPVTP